MGEHSAEGPAGDESTAPGEQLEISVASARKAARSAVKSAKPKKQPELAAELPVARIVVDKALSHLDQFFDYAVPASMSADAQPGVRVRVRFGGHAAGDRRRGGGLIDGIIVERLATSDYSGPLARIERVLSPEPVLPDRMLDLARAVADRYAGTLADVLSLALPPRHARVEAEPAEEPLPAPPRPETGSWARYEGGQDILDALSAGESPRSVWTALPGPTWPDEIARLMATCLAAGRGALVVLPDGKAVGRVDEALEHLLGRGRHIALTADAGPEERYRRWLAVSRGTVKAVVGTRAAMFAPVADLGLVALWDDGDSAHAELHAPQPHVREVLVVRALRERSAFLVGGLTTSVDAAQLVRSGWAQPLEAVRTEVRAAAPLVRTVGDLDVARDEAARTARLPSLAWDIARRGLETGPVLVQVPRRGYVPHAACQRCRASARCGGCAGPLELTGSDGALVCSWCGRHEVGWRCQECGGAQLRASIVGARRTAEELGRAFPRVPVRTSGRDAVLSVVPDVPALVVATPGAEPVAAGGYAAALLLDGWLLLNRPDLRAGEEALRRWLAAASLVRPASAGGAVVIVAEPTLRAVQALVRWDPQGFARTELGERHELGLPPVSRMASVTGSPTAVADLMRLVRLPQDTDILGPVPAPLPPRPAVATPARNAKTRAKSAAARAAIERPPAEASTDIPLWGGTTRAQVGPPPEERRERILLRVSPGRGAELAAALKAAQALRMSRGPSEPVWVRMDPLDIG
ncbi:primosomal protein N' [Yinghuangia soli]|uniref:primosomal protein N' n=1 Tax=Yinghuangia soli TaxID=2908204 RepID=UPI0027E2924C|nr:primosomal protein N' [Yinghuangia soli]